MNASRRCAEAGRKGLVEGASELVVSRTPFIMVNRLRMERIEILRVLHGALMSQPCAGFRAACLTPHWR